MSFYYVILTIKRKKLLWNRTIIVVCIIRKYNPVPFVQFNKVLLLTWHLIDNPERQEFWKKNVNFNYYAFIILIFMKLIRCQNYNIKNF